MATDDITRITAKIEQNSVRSVLHPDIELTKLTILFTKLTLLTTKPN